MKVCVVSSMVLPCPPPGYSGLEMIAWQQAKGLAAKGHEVSLVAPDGSTCPGVTVIPCGPVGQWDERACYGGFGEMKNGEQVVRRAHPGYWQHLLQVECILDHSWNKFSYLLKMEGRLPKTPILGICHAPVSTMMQSLPPVDKPCFVCISQDQADHFEALFSRPARVARNGINVDHYKSMNIPRTDRYLFLARFSSVKGPDIAQDACSVCNVGLDMVGDTSITNEPELLERCKKKADGKQIRIIGGVNRGETVWWFSQAHCLLHPNKIFREPAGLSPLEAMACGTPVIGWRHGALKETVRHGETGFLVDSTEEMIELIKNNAVASINRKRCREWVCDTYTEQKMVDTYDNLIHEAVAGGW